MYIFLITTPCILLNHVFMRKAIEMRSIFLLARCGGSSCRMLTLKHSWSDSENLSKIHLDFALSPPPKCHFSHLFLASFNSKFPLPSSLSVSPALSSQLLSNMGIYECGSEGRKEEGEAPWVWFVAPKPRIPSADLYFPVTHNYNSSLSYPLRASKSFRLAWSASLLLKWIIFVTLLLMKEPYMGGPSWQVQIGCSCLCELSWRW